ncbi:MAG: collagen binding domain-containing protein, partial [Thermoanaerobaculia bacterium]
EAFDPADRSVVVTLGQGAAEEYEFRYRHARGKVVGYIFAEKTQEPLHRVGLLLTPAAGGKTLRTESGPGGEFAFTGVPTGNYALSFEQAKYALDGLEWVPAHGTPHRQHVCVVAGKTQYLKPCFLSQDEHLLTVRVLSADGAPVSNAQFEVMDENEDRVGVFGTGSDGSEVVPLARAGTYRVALSTFDNGEIRYAPESVYVNQPAEAILRLRGGGGVPRPPFPPGPAEAIVDIPYPLLTEGASPSGWGSQSAPSSALDLGMTVEKTLRDVLGWKSKGFKGNAKGFREALSQSFALQAVQGHTEFTWTPRSYTVQADLGNITGAQASIYNRAKVALDQSLPLLDGLYPLSPAADEQNMDAIRAIVRSGFTELVNELGIEGGPRVVRIDALFEQLLGVRAGQAPSTNPEQVGGQFGLLSRIFGLRRDRINTIAEEQDLTNFLIVVDYVTGLYQSWLNQRPFFTRTSAEPFLGTQLVHVSRSLAVVAEGVQEVYMAMDSVFVGHAERQVVELTYPGEPSLFVAELLSWVESAASEEGPELIQNGGKAGVVAFQPTLDRLALLVNGALVPPQNPAALPAGYRTARVQRALQELAEHLDETARLAGQIRLQDVA